ncbi:MAG: beta-ketoacyl-[acyl-carrier-protein] synthase family protein [bacterium]
MDTARPVILGYDAVSPLGTTLEQQWEAAERGDSGIAALTRFPLGETFPVRVAGQVPEIDTAPYPFLSPRALAHWKSPVFAHALLVTHRALERAGLEITPEIAPRVAITMSTAIGGLDAVIGADRRFVAEGKLPHPFDNPNSCINMIGGKVSILTGATGPIATTITACATGNTSMIIGSMYLAMGMADVAICGAVDFPLVEPIVGGFATMQGAYQQRDRDPPQDPRRASRPFSLGRRGFVVSEGAAAIIIATREFADAHGLPYAAEIAGWATTADAHHFVAPHPPEVGRCVRETIAHAGLAPGDIDAINGHAASTRVGDAVEVQVLREVFEEPGRIPPVSANKSQIGHAMGASSAVESVFALESLRRATLLPTINYEPDPELELDCVAEGARPLTHEHVLKNAFGFGGCNACLVFRRLA